MLSRANSTDIRGTILDFRHNRHALDSPDLRDGLCTRPGGRAILDRAVNKKGHENTKAVKLMCFSCPVYKLCETWVLEKEEPAGRWGHVIAGMTQRERRKIREESNARASEAAAITTA